MKIKVSEKAVRVSVERPTDVTVDCENLKMEKKIYLFRGGDWDIYERFSEDKREWKLWCSQVR